MITRFSIRNCTITRLRSPIRRPLWHHERVALGHVGDKSSGWRMNVALLRPRSTQSGLLPPVPAMFEFLTAGGSGHICGTDITGSALRQ